MVLPPQCVQRWQQTMASSERGKARPATGYEGHMRLAPPERHTCGCCTSLTNRQDIDEAGRGEICPLHTNLNRITFTGLANAATVSWPCM